MTDDEALDKLKHYCAYQERCHQEVRYKLISIKVYGEQLEQIIIALIDEDYLNEERFARSYARGKYRMKKWGRNRIKRELKYRKISDYCIRKGLEEIESEGGYEEQLISILEKYITTRKDKWAKNILRSKAYEHAMIKGYESNLIISTLDKLKEKLIY